MVRSRLRQHCRRSVAFALAVFVFLGVGLSARAFVPNDPQFDEQWYLKAIGAPAAWDYTLGAPAVTVAVLDTGVDLSHPEFKESIWHNAREVLNGMDDDGNGYADDLRGWNFVEDVGDPQPRFTSFIPAGANHGTVLAGLLAARGGNGQGIAGVAWRVRLLPIRVLGSEGRGGEENVVSGIEYAVKNKADIISMSFVTTPSPDIRAAVKRAAESGILIVAAAGLQQSAAGRPNVGPNFDRAPGDPVCADGPNGENWVIGVGAVDQNDRLSLSSGYGQCIDILAPGERVYSTQAVRPEHGLVSPYGGGWVGPSLSVPMVAGAAALIKSAAPQISAAGLRDLLLNTADTVDAVNPEFAGRLGHGRLNLARAFLSLGARRQAPAQIAVSRGAGTAPEVRLLDQSGGVVRSFYAYDPRYRGGVHIASGDLDGNGHDEIITLPGSGAVPMVKVFDSQGSLLLQFSAAPPGDRRGYTVASGDLDGDGRDEIITAPITGETRVRIFSGIGAQRKTFIAYPERGFSGVTLAAGDTDGDGVDELIAVPGGRVAPLVRVFDQNGSLQNEFIAGAPRAARGLTLAVADRAAGGRDLISILRAGEKTVREYDRDGVAHGSFDVGDGAFVVSAASGDPSRDGSDRIVLGTGGARGGSLILFSRGGEDFRVRPFGAGNAPIRAALVPFP